MRWWAGCFIRELPPLPVNVPGGWHVCGTSHACRGGPLVADLGLILPAFFARSRALVLLIIPSAVDPPVRSPLASLRPFYYSQLR
jgi:hypothetical protein